MSNRAQRRQLERKGSRYTGHEAVRQRPVGEHGFEVDTANGLVHMAFHMGEGCLSIAHNERDSRKIAEMILDACDRIGTPSEQIVEERNSGIVVARTLPPT